jgi:chromosomal replication initiator protein
MENTHTKVWESCLAILKDNVPPQSFKTWFEPIKSIKLKDSVLTIQVPSQFVYEYIEEHYINLLKKAIKRELGADARLEYSIVMENSRSSKPYTVKIPGMDKPVSKSQPVNLPIDINKNPIRNPFIIPGLKKVDVAPQLNQNNSFENFIEGDCNRLARSAGFAIAQKPGGTSFNPLFIYGSVGLGKTHLAHAIGLEIKINFPGKTVLYVSSTSSTFTR